MGPLLLLLQELQTTEEEAFAEAQGSQAGPLWWLWIVVAAVAVFAVIRVLRNYRTGGPWSR